LKSIESVVGKKRLKRVWKKADDCIQTTRLLSDMYSDVPPDVDCPVEILEIHVFDKADRKKALAWLDRRDSQPIYEVSLGACPTASEDEHAQPSTP
jgi:hypothetical protein